MAAVAILLLALGLQFLSSAAQTPVRASGFAPRRPSADNIPPLPEFAAILRSPVFAPDRRPGAAELAAIGGGELSAYAALGSAAGGGAATGVISGPGGKARTVGLGDSVAGWKLVSIDRARLVFERDGARHSLAVGAPALVLLQAETGGSRAAAGADGR